MRCDFMICGIFDIYGSVIYSYVLPWSQMGFWAVMVILSIFDNIPVIGLFVNEW